MRAKRGRTEKGKGTNERHKPRLGDARGPSIFKGGKMMERYCIVENIYLTSSIILT